MARRRRPSQRSRISNGRRNNVAAASYRLAYWRVPRLSAACSQRISCSQYGVICHDRARPQPQRSGLLHARNAAKRCVVAS